MSSNDPSKRFPVYDALMQHSEGVLLRFRARLRPDSQRIQSHSLRPYIWVKEQGSGLCLVAKQTLISESSPMHGFEREFLVEVRASDDTIAIYEANASGGFGGCVFARARVPLLNPRGQHIKVSDIYSGVLLPVAGRTFDVLEADAFTMKYVRANPNISTAFLY